MKKQIFILFGMLMSIAIFSQGVLTPLKAWSTNAGTQYFFYKNVVKVYGDYTYIAGATMNASGNYDLLVAKYDDRGVLEWIQQIDGDDHFHDFATALYINDTAVYVTGAITNDTLYSFSDIVTLKLDITDGSVMWEETFDGAGMVYDCGADIIADDSGFVYVTGSGYNDIYKKDYITLRYNSAGTLLWNSIYEYEGEHDAGVKIIYDGGRLYVLGACQTTADTTIYDAVTIQINQYSGAVLNSSASSGGGSNVDYVNDFTRDTIGNLYVAGSIEVTSEGYNSYVAKLDSNLVFQWEVTYNGADDLDESANGVKVDNSTGDVYIAGYTTDDDSRKDWLIVKYDAGGSQQWVETYNDALDGDDEAMSLELKSGTEIIVTGYDSTSTGMFDYYTVKYDDSGTKIWDVREGGIANSIDKALNMAIDYEGAIIITGESKTAGGSYEYRTIKYVEKTVITPTDQAGEVSKGSFSYIQNYGQIIDSDTNLVPSIKFYTERAYPMQYIKDNSHSYVFAQLDTTLAADTLQRIDVTYTNVSGSAKSYAMEEKDDYLSFFLSYIPEPVAGVPTNARVITTDLYPYTDLEFSSNQNGIKYYYIVKPGGIPTNIKMTWTGATSFNLDGTSNALTINSTVGSITFDRPSVYQLTTGNVVVPITAWTPAWVTDGASNKYKFTLGAYDSTKVLIIEVDQGNMAHASMSAIDNCEHSTYYGGFQDDYFNDVMTTPDGSVYTAGITRSSTFPQFTGILTSGYMGSYDAVSVKFDSDMKRMFAMFYGGTGEDWGMSTTVGTDLKVRLAGFTASSSIPQPTKAGALNDHSYGGGLFDGFIVECDTAAANLTWGTYLGGSGHDRITQVRMDGSGSYYAIGRGSSGIPIKSKTNAYNSSSGAGYICKFNLADTVTWSALVPGVSGDFQDIAMNTGANSKFLVCSASNNSFPNYQPYWASYYDTLLSSVTDIGIIKLDAADTIRWATFYGGNNNDFGYGITVDNTGEVYITGTTVSSDFPCFRSGTEYYDTINLTDAFIVKFDFQGIRRWATCFGGDTQMEIGFKITTDQYLNVYIVGTTASTDFITENLASAYYQTETNADLWLDGFITSFDKAGQMVWSTYFSGNGQDQALSVAKRGSKLYVVGQTMAPYDFPLADLGSGAWFEDTLNLGFDPSSYSDGFIARFDLTPIIVLGTDDKPIANSELIIYPNPSNGNTIIQLDLKNEADIKIEVVSMLGQTVYKKQLGKKIGILRENVDLSDMANGVYFVSVIVDNKRLSAKIIKN